MDYQLIMVCFICGLIGAWAILARKRGHGRSSSRVSPGIISSDLRARDLPSKRLLGKGLASIGYETELNGMRFARIDFIGAPSGTFQKEATVVAGLKDHKNVVKAYDWVVEKMSCSLVLEYMEDDLLGYMQKRKESQGSPAHAASGKPSRSQPFELPEALEIILQIARGMECLHEQNIVHGDLKTKNILVTRVKEEGRNALLLVKVADYGLVRTKRKSMSFVSRQARKLDVVQWKAPENLKRLLSEDKNETSSESDLNSDDECVVASDSMLLSGDVYSFAVTCFQILTGEDPYPNLNWKELGARIVSGTLRPKLPAACPSLLNDLLVSCWDKAPAQRPGFSPICRILEVILLDPQTLATKDFVPILNAATRKASTEEAAASRRSRWMKYILGLAPKKRIMRKNPKQTSSSDATTDLSENSEFSGFSGTSLDGSAELEVYGEIKFPVRRDPFIQFWILLLGGWKPYIASFPTL